MGSRDDCVFRSSGQNKRYAHCVFRTESKLHYENKPSAAFPISSTCSGQLKIRTPKRAVDPHTIKIIQGWPLAGPHFKV